MKPSKNRYFCIACKRPKMLFETEGSAKKFLQFNSEEIDEETGKAPIRSYYCPYCLGWHVTSNPNVEYFLSHKTKNEEQIDAIVEDNIQKAEEKKMRLFNKAQKYVENGQYDCAIDTYLLAFHNFKNKDSVEAERMLDYAYDTEKILLQNIINGSWKGFEKDYSIKKLQKRLKTASIGLEQKFERKKAEIQKYLQTIATEKQQVNSVLEQIGKLEQTVTTIDNYITLGQKSEAISLINECAGTINDISDNNTVVEKNKLVTIVDQLILLRQKVDQES